MENEIKEIYCRERIEFLQRKILDCFYELCNANKYVKSDFESASKLLKINESLIVTETMYDLKLAEYNLMFIYMMLNGYINIKEENINVIYYENLDDNHNVINNMFNVNEFLTINKLYEYIKNTYNIVKHIIKNGVHNYRLNDVGYNIYSVMVDFKKYIEEHNI